MTQALAQNNPAVPLNPALQPLSYASGIATIGKVALFIIGCLGATGLIPVSSLGWASLGLASAVLALELSASDNHTNEKIFATIQTVVMVTLSILAGANLLNAAQLGWGIVGTTAIAVPYKIYYFKKRIHERNIHAERVAAARLHEQNIPSERVVAVARSILRLARIALANLEAQENLRQQNSNASAHPPLNSQIPSESGR